MRCGCSDAQVFIAVLLSGCAGGMTGAGAGGESGAAGSAGAVANESGGSGGHSSTGGSGGGVGGYAGAGAGGVGGANVGSGGAGPGGAGGAAAGGNAGGASAMAGNGGASNLVPTIVAVGYNGWRVRSRDLGKTWTDRIKVTDNASIDKYNLFRSVTYGAGLFVAVGEYITTSPDGATWTVANTPPKEVNGSKKWGFIPALAYGNGIFIAAAEFTFVSKDGRTWEYGKPACTTCGTDWVRSLAFGDGKFMAMYGNGQVFATTDGQTWTVDTTYKGASVAYCKGGFRPRPDCQPWNGFGVIISSRWNSTDVFRLTWSNDGGKTFHDSNTIEPYPAIWSETADWLAFGYSPP